MIWPKGVRLEQSNIASNQAQMFQGQYINLYKILMYI